MLRSLVGSEMCIRDRPPAERGALYNRQMYQMRFFCTFACPARRPGVVSRAMSCGPRRGGRVFTLAHVCVPAGLHGARSGRSKSRDLATNHGSLSAETDPTRPVETRPKKYNVFVASPLSAAVSEAPKQPSKATQPRHTSLCDSHERCFCVGVRGRACVYVIYSRILALQWYTR